AATPDLSLPEMALPRSDTHRLGDQRAPALASVPLWPYGAIVAAWEDDGRVFGAAERNADVVAEVLPSPLFRADEPGPLACDPPVQPRAGVTVPSNLAVQLLEQTPATGADGTTFVNSINGLGEAVGETWETGSGTPGFGARWSQVAGL